MCNSRARIFKDMAKKRAFLNPLKTKLFHDIFINYYRDLKKERFYARFESRFFLWKYHKSKKRNWKPNFFFYENTGPEVVVGGVYSDSRAGIFTNKIAI